MVVEEGFWIEVRGGSVQAKMGMAAWIGDGD